MSEQEKGGAAAFIAGVEASVGADLKAGKDRRDGQVARVVALLKKIMAEDAPFCREDGVPEEYVDMASLGTALGAAASAMGVMLNATMPRTYTPEMNMTGFATTIQSIVNLISDRVRF